MALRPRRLLALLLFALLVGGTVAVGGAEAARNETTIADSDELALQAGAGQVIYGQTSLSPGTKVAVRVQSSGSSPFLKSVETTVDQSGTYRAVFDFADVPAGAEIRIKVIHNGTELASTRDKISECTTACDRGSTSDPRSGTSFTGAEPISVEAGPGQVIRGQTSLPAGASVQVDLRTSTGSAFITSREVHVTQNGSFYAVFDFSEMGPGSRFEVIARYNASRIANVTGEVTTCKQACEATASDDGSSAVRIEEGMEDGFTATRGEIVGIPIALGNASTVVVNVTATDSTGNETFVLSAMARDGSGDNRVVLLFNTSAAVTGNDAVVQAANSGDRVTVSSRSKPVAVNEYLIAVATKDAPSPADVTALTISASGGTPPLTMTDGSLERFASVTTIGALAGGTVLGIFGIILLIRVVEL